VAPGKELGFGKGLVVVVFAAVIFFPALAWCEPAATKPLDCGELMGWLIGGIASPRLDHLIQQRGVVFTVDDDAGKALLQAGAAPGLVADLRTKRSANTERESTDCPAPLIEAATQSHLRHYQEAERILRRLVTDDSHNPALHFALGFLRQKQQDWDEARDQYQQSEAGGTGFLEVHNRLSYSFYRSGDEVNAIAEARTALSMDPQNAEAYRNVGLGLYSSGDYAGAIHAFRESLVRNPRAAYVHYDLGIALHDIGNSDAAAAEYRQALRLDRHLWEAHSNLGIVLHETGKLDEAIAEYHFAKRLAPHEPTVRNNLANTYCDRGDFDAAIREFRELYRMNPDWQQGHDRMAKAFMAKRDYQAAILQLRQAILQNPTGSVEHRVLGQALLLINQREEAIGELRQAVALDPDSPLAHHYLGAALFELRRLEEAALEFREALRLEATADDHYDLAACLMSMGHNDDALAEMEIATRMAPGQELYRARREELIRLMGTQAAR